MPNNPRPYDNLPPEYQQQGRIDPRMADPSAREQAEAYARQQQANPYGQQQAEAYSRHQYAGRRSNGRAPRQTDYATRGNPAASQQPSNTDPRRAARPSTSTRPRTKRTTGSPAPRRSTSPTPRWNGTPSSQRRSAPASGQGILEQVGDIVRSVTRRYPWLPYAIGAVLVILIAGFVIRGCMAGPKVPSAQAPSASTSAPAAPEAPASPEAAPATAAPEGAAASSDTSTASAESEPPRPIVQNALTDKIDAALKLGARPLDFALNPTRTNWNYESNGRKVVYLTFDDGPSYLTQSFLDVLDQYGCKATFFVVGHDPDCYHLIKEAHDRGHTIGLHTYSHDYGEVYASPDAYYADLDAIAQVVKDQIGYVPCFIRFPGGSSNTISANYYSGIMSELVNSVQERGYQYYDWNASSGDGSVHSAGELIEIAKEGAGTENIILLCHDAGAKQSTLDALPSIIEYYRDQGYTFEAIDRSTMVPHHGVGN